MEGFAMPLGLLMFASWIYMMTAQFKTLYKDRNMFGKIATWFAIATFTLFVIGSIQTSNSQDPALMQSDLTTGV